MENKIYTFAEIIVVLEEGQFAVNDNGTIITRTCDGCIVEVEFDDEEEYYEDLNLNWDILNSEWSFYEKEQRDYLGEIDKKAKELYDLIKEYVYKDGGSRERATEVMQLMIKYQTFMG